MIIVEGPDGAGKTTLIKKLSNTLNWGVAARVVSKEASPLLDLQVWVDENLNKGFHECIYDRHRLISEPIYGPIIRGTNAPGFDDLNWLTPRLFTLYRHIRPVIIYCLPPFRVVESNVVADPDNWRIAPSIEAIYGAYCDRVARDLAGQMPGFATIIWQDYTAQSHTYDELLRKVYLGMNQGSLV